MSYSPMSSRDIQWDHVFKVLSELMAAGKFIGLYTSHESEGFISVTVKLHANRELLDALSKAYAQETTP